MCRSGLRKTLCRTRVVNFTLAHRSRPTRPQTYNPSPNPSPQTPILLGGSRSPGGSHAARVLDAFCPKKRRAAERPALTNKTRILRIGAGRSAPARRSSPSNAADYAVVLFSLLYIGRQIGGAWPRKILGAKRSPGQQNGEPLLFCVPLPLLKCPGTLPK